MKVILLTVIMLMGITSFSQKKEAKMDSYADSASCEIPLWHSLSYMEVKGNYHCYVSDNPVFGGVGTGCRNLLEGTYIILNLGEYMSAGGRRNPADSIFGKYIGCEYTADSSLIYYVAHMENLSVTADTMISFELKKFRLSLKPIDLRDVVISDTIDISDDDDRQTRIECANRKQLTVCDLGYKYTGSYKNGTLNLTRTSPAYDSRSDQFLFHKIPQRFLPCQLAYYSESVEEVKKALKSGDIALLRALSDDKAYKSLMSINTKRMDTALFLKKLYAELNTAILNSSVTDLCEEQVAECYWSVPVLITYHTFNMEDTPYAYVLGFKDFCGIRLTYFGKQRKRRVGY